MSSQYTDEEHPDVESARLSVMDAYLEAQDVLDEYDSTLQLTALQGDNPHQDPDVQRAKILLHIAVMRLWRRLPRVKIRRKFEEYWDEVELYDDSNGTELYGLKSLEAIQGAVTKTVHEEYRRHQGTVAVEDWDAVMLPGPAYRRSINVMGELLELFGYVRPPRDPMSRSELDESEPDPAALESQKAAEQEADD